MAAPVAGLGPQGSEDQSQLLTPTARVTGPGRGHVTQGEPIVIFLWNFLNWGRGNFSWLCSCLELPGAFCSERAERVFPGH